MKAGKEDDENDEEEKKAIENKTNVTDLKENEKPKIGIIALQNKPLHYQCND